MIFYPGQPIPRMKYLMAIGMRVGISLSSMQRLNCHQLTWSDKLTAVAKNWAEEMKATAGFSHSPSCAAGKGEYGEAIAGIFNRDYCWDNPRTA